MLKKEKKNILQGFIIIEFVCPGAFTQELHTNLIAAQG